MSWFPPASTRAPDRVRSRRGPPAATREEIVLSIDDIGPSRAEVVEALELHELLIRAARALAGLRQRIATGHGLTAAGLAVLAVLDRGAHPSHRDLAAELGITPGALTSTVDLLEERGHVERVLDLEDRRIVRLRVTTRGLAVLGAAHEGVTRELRHVLPAPSATEQEVVRRYLLGVFAAADGEPHRSP